MTDPRYVVTNTLLCVLVLVSTVAILMATAPNA